MAVVMKAWIKILMVWVAGILTIGSGWGCHKPVPREKKVIHVAAAASLINVIQQADSIFQVKFPGVKIEESFAATSILARQLEQGAPFDVVLSANPEWINYLVAKRLMDTTSIVVFAYNSLVVISASASPPDVAVADWLLTHREQRIAIANWHHVPAGKYARHALKRMGIWETVEPFLVLAVDVRAALSYVEKGHVGAGIVYYSDRLVTPEVPFAVIPKTFQPQILYEGGVTYQANAIARQYLTFLKSPLIQQLFKQYGFLAAEEIQLQKGK